MSWGSTWQEGVPPAESWPYPTRAHPWPPWFWPGPQVLASPLPADSEPPKRTGPDQAAGGKVREAKGSGRVGQPHRLGNGSWVRHPGFELRISHGALGLPEPHFLTSAVETTLPMGLLGAQPGQHTVGALCHHPRLLESGWAEACAQIH